MCTTQACVNKCVRSVQSAFCSVIAFPPPPDPRFISVHLIPESDNPEDDKVFLFFKENAMDGEHTGKATISRIGQLCKVTTHTQVFYICMVVSKRFAQCCGALLSVSCVWQNDMGGHRSLVNKWTTFLKARLLCSVPGVNGIDTHFDELRKCSLFVCVCGGGG